MRAWRFTSAGKGLTRHEIAAPRPAANEVLIDIAAAGLCHSDVGLLHGEGQPLPFTPITLGHEISGEITELGADVTGWRVGDRVAVISDPAGPGFGRDGGYAEQVVARPDELVAVPETVDDAVAALATDAGLTSYHAVLKQGRVQAGMKVGVIGLGGLGMIGARIAAGVGAEVYAAEIKGSLFPLAAEQGVIACSAAITDFTDRRLDVIIDFAGMDTTGGAFKAIRPGGRVVQVGIGRPTATIEMLDVLLKQLEYVGSIIGTKEDLAGFLALAAEGKVTPLVERIAFDEIGEGIERLGRGEVVGRLVAVR
ncbi:zinc-binding dehydrogenase [Paractinoplanes lichenicola]|uniref:Zinc-binding dehydrogenase n=1 Tax=Paractinoplanes lichenicola TaxID=2802976 RepID=A0ABS1VMK4_9ACTN|nr:zinc-binding dehydrogenase [Actinoplanes lichenicola]MBL7255962.1 zinc-binding dehydrogenase [Actinoplanes lichenicola]